MDWHGDWQKAQRDLSQASRNDLWWKTLPEDRRTAMGRRDYRSKCVEARCRVKAADERCRELLRLRRGKAPRLAA